MTAAIRIKVSNCIRELRADLGVTQEELARRAGVTRVTINCIERGVYLPSLELGLKLARIFRKTVEDVFVVREEKA